MGKHSGEDVVETITRFKRNILEKKPDQPQMFVEVRMMKFRLKPIQGDISMLDLRNTKFIETLWELGKLDEFYHEYIHKVPIKQKQMFFRLFDDLYQKTQNNLNMVNLRLENEKETPPFFEVEIFKDKTAKAN